MRLSETSSLAALMAPGAGRGRKITTRDWRLDLDQLEQATSLGDDLATA